MEPEHHSHRFFTQSGVSAAQLLDYAKRARVVGSVRLLRHSRYVREGGAVPDRGVLWAPQDRAGPLAPPLCPELLGSRAAQGPQTPS